MEDKTYLNYPDGREMTNEQFYAAMRNGSMPTTTQITSARFVEIFEPHLKEETDLLYICFSSALSATYERSVTAVEELREKISSTPNLYSRFPVLQVWEKACL